LIQRLELARTLAISLAGVLVAGLFLQTRTVDAAHSDTPVRIGPVVTVATGLDWTLKAWRSDEGLCISHRRPSTTYCIGRVMRGGPMFTGFTGPPSNFVVTGVVTRVVQRLVVVDAASRRSLTLYRAPRGLNTGYRFFRERVKPRGPNPTGIRWKLTALDSQGREVSFTGQGRNVG
jgi:hypothetical protein